MAIEVEPVATGRDICANARCGHVRALHGEDTCRINGCGCLGFRDRPSRTRGFPRVPVLGFTPQLDDDGRSGINRLIVGMDALTLDGARFPWETVGDWTVKFTEDGIATLNVAIAVTLPTDPAVVPDGD